MAWVGSEVLPHEPAVRVWLRRLIDAADVEDVIQESYCRISGLADVRHIRNGRAYFFTTARMLVAERIRRSRVVSIETVAELDSIQAACEGPSPEQIAAGRRELARVRMLIESLPERCQRIVELRKIDGWSQRDVARMLGLPESTIENDVAKGLRLILRAIATQEEQAETALSKVGHHDQDRDRDRDRTVDQ